MGFPRQEYWSGVPFPSPGDLPHPGIEPWSPALTGGFLTTEPPGMCVCAQSFSRVQIFVIPWTVARQAPPSMEFPGQEYWSGVPFPPPGHPPDPGIEPTSLALAGGLFTAGSPGKQQITWAADDYTLNSSESWFHHLYNRHKITATFNEIIHVKVCVIYPTNVEFFP